MNKSKIFFISCIVFIILNSGLVFSEYNLSGLISSEEGVICYDNDKLEQIFLQNKTENSLNIYMVKNNVFKINCSFCEEVFLFGDFKKFEGGSVDCVLKDRDKNWFKIDIYREEECFLRTTFRLPKEKYINFNVKTYSEIEAKEKCLGLSCPNGICDKEPYENYKNCPDDCCEEGYLEEYKCRGSKSMKKYVYYNCSYEYVFDNHCEDGCNVTLGTCNQKEKISEDGFIKKTIVHIKKFANVVIGIVDFARSIIYIIVAILVYLFFLYKNTKKKRKIKKRINLLEKLR